MTSVSLKAQDTDSFDESGDPVIESMAATIFSVKVTPRPKAKQLASARKEKAEQKALLKMMEIIASSGPSDNQLTGKVQRDITRMHKKMLEKRTFT